MILQKIRWNPRYGVCSQFSRFSFIFICTSVYTHIHLSKMRTDQMCRYYPSSRLLDWVEWLLFDWFLLLVGQHHQRSAHSLYLKIKIKLNYDPIGSIRVWSAVHWVRKFESGLKNWSAFEMNVPSLLPWCAISETNHRHRGGKGSNNSRWRVIFSTGLL